MSEYYNKCYRCARQVRVNMVGMGLCVCGAELPKGIKEKREAAIAARTPQDAADELSMLLSRLRREGFDIWSTFEDELFVSRDADEALAGVLD